MKYFGGNLNRHDARGAFQYKKGGNRKRGVVAKAWRKLVAEDTVVRANWESMQAGAWRQVSPCSYVISPSNCVHVPFSMVLTVLLIACRSDLMFVVQCSGTYTTSSF